MATSQVCDGIANCHDESDENEELCFVWNCTEDMWKCRDYERCVKTSSLCDGDMQCLDSSDEEYCIDYNCLNNDRKCADNIQCIQEISICDGKIDCHDGSDELCKASCLQSQITNRTIIRRCSEDNRVCVPVDKYCDRGADCPLGSDEAESDCTCDDWNLLSCSMQQRSFCIYAEWITLHQNLNVIHPFSECQIFFKHLFLWNSYINVNLMNKLGLLLNHSKFTVRPW